MDLVRESMGDDAVIVSTREDKDRAGNPLIQITAAIDNDSKRFFDSEQPDQDWGYQDEDDESLVEEITEALMHHSVPEEILDYVISHVSMLDVMDARTAFSMALERLFSFKPLPILPESKPLMMVGPPGAGKTLAVAKMAARSAMAGLDIAVVTTDTERAGGQEQLEAFTRLMNIDLKTAKSATQLKEILLAVKGADQVIIDTAGANPFDKASIHTLTQFIEVSDLDVAMVLPANTNAEEAGEMAEVFAAIGAQRLLSTRIDAARRLGALLAAAHQGALAFADVSATAKVADGLSPLNAKRLTQLLMPRAQNVTMQKHKRTGS